MLNIEYFHLPDGKISIQFNPENPEVIPMLKDSLRQFNIYNPAYTFSQKYKNNEYASHTDEYASKDADLANLLAELWKEPNQKDAELEKFQNAMIILSRLTEQYIEEHNEVIRLRKELKYYTDYF